MPKEIKYSCRSFLGTAAQSMITAERALTGTAHASFDKPKRSKPGLAPIKPIKAGVPGGYYKARSNDGPPVLL